MVKIHNLVYPKNVGLSFEELWTFVDNLALDAYSEDITIQLSESQMKDYLVIYNALGLKSIKMTEHTAYFCDIKLTSNRT